MREREWCVCEVCVCVKDVYEHKSTDSITAYTIHLKMYSIYDESKTGRLLMGRLVLRHAAATRGHVPLMGLSHDQMVCFEGLPDLPGARQEVGRPAGTSQAVSPPLDGQTSARGSSRATRVVAPSVRRCFPQAVTPRGVCPGAVTPYEAVFALRQ